MLNDAIVSCYKVLSCLYLLSLIQSFLSLTFKRQSDNDRILFCHFDRAKRAEKSLQYSCMEISRLHFVPLEMTMCSISRQCRSLLFMFNYVYSLKFVLYIADDLTVEKVDDALCACGVFLRVCHHHDGSAFLVEFCKQIHDLLAVL